MPGRSSGLPVDDQASLGIAKEFCKLAKNNSVDSMLRFLQRNPGFNVETPFANGFTALHYACKYFSEDATIFLMVRGADINNKAIDGTMPLDFAKLKPEFGKKLLEFAKDLEEREVWHIRSINQERNDRYQLGDISYNKIFKLSPGIVDDSYSIDLEACLQRLISASSSVDVRDIMHVLYLITAKNSSICSRVDSSGRTILDACFERTEGYQLSLTLTYVGIPHEYVNSRYIIATDILSKQTLAKIDAFCRDPLNLYSKEEVTVIEDKESQGKYQREMAVGKVPFDITKYGISLAEPESVFKKFYQAAPPGLGYAFVRKTDNESQLYFARVARKIEIMQQSVGRESGKYECLAWIARESLESTFSPALDTTLVATTAATPNLLPGFTAATTQSHNLDSALHETVEKTSNATEPFAGLKPGFWK